MEFEGLAGWNVREVRVGRWLELQLAESRLANRATGWLTPRGLAFNEHKTRVVTLNEGFDFLGFDVRRYRHKPLIKPSEQAVRRIRERLRQEVRSLRGTNAAAVIKRLNPIIRGWVAYYRTQVSARVFNALDHYLWRLICKWAVISHSNRPKRWLFARYFGRFNKARQDRWVFGDRASGAYLHKFAWTNIIRHQIVKHGASTDDPSLVDYWAHRRRRTPLPINQTTRRLLAAQDGRCAICNNTLYAYQQPASTQQWEQWLRNARTSITVQAPSTPEVGYRLIHTDCHHGSRPATLRTQKPQGLAWSMRLVGGESQSHT